MIFPDVTPEYWCERNGIEIKSLVCPRCGLVQKTTIPYLAQECVGLLAPKHACGSDFQASTMVARDPRERREWRELAQGLLGSLPD